MTMAKTSTKRSKSGGKKRDLHALDGYMTIATAAKEWGISTQQVRRYLARKLIKGAKIDKKTHGIPVWNIPQNAKQPKLAMGRPKRS